MAEIATHLYKIMSAVFGEEVRSSIHDAIKAINDENVNVLVNCNKAKAAAEESRILAEDSAEEVTKLIEIVEK